MMFTNFIGAQNQWIPIRIGDKFGVIDKDGKVQIKADYDYIKFGTASDYLTAFTFANAKNPFKTSLIYKNKVIVKDAYYFDYFISNQTIEAIHYYEVRPEGNQSNIKERKQMFDNNGKRIFDQDLQDIILFKYYDTKNRKDLVVITVDSSGISNLYLYNKAQQKIAKKLLSDFYYVENVFEKYYDGMLTFKYKNKANEYRIYHLKMEPTTFSFFADEKVIPVMNNKEEGFGWNSVSEPVMGVGKVEIDKYTTYPIQKFIIKATQVNAAPQLPEINTFTLQSENLKLSYSDGKVGLIQFKNLQKDSISIIPPIHDNIFLVNESNYMFKDGGQYGIYVSTNKGLKKIEAFTDKLIVPIYVNDFEQNPQLYLMLFDAQTHQFFCYADTNGQIYYKAQ